LFAKQKQICDYRVTEHGWYRKAAKVAITSVTKNTQKTYTQIKDEQHNGE